MTGICGKEKKDDALVTVSLEGKGLDISIESKVKILFGKHIEQAVKDVCLKYNVEDAKICVQDFGALDFVIRARTKTALQMAEKKVNL